MEDSGPVQVGVRGYCFSADCILAYEAVKRRTGNTLRTIEELLSFVKQRASVEESYSKSLYKLSQTTITCVPGTLNEGLEGMKGDISNSSTQRKQFSEHLMTDVYEPLNECKNKVNNSFKYLQNKVQRLQKQLKNTEEQYNKSCTKYEKCYREMVQSIAACRENGATEPNLTADISTLTMEESKSAPIVTAATTNTRQSKKSRPFSSPFSKMLESSNNQSENATAGEDNAVSPSQGSKLVHWLLPTDEERKGELTATATQHLINAELARRACWDAWKDIAELSHNGTIEYMHALADFQTLEEESINTMQDHLKKMLVFECSAVANQQYDLQMLFKVLESISCSKDLVSFMRAQSTASQEGQAPAAFADMVGRGSCTPFTALPAPPTARTLEPPPFLNHDIPVMSTINLEVQLTMPSLYRSASAETHEHLQGEEHESKIECNLVPAAELVEYLKQMERKGRGSSSDSKSDAGTPTSRSETAHGASVPTVRLAVSTDQLSELGGPPSPTHNQATIDDRVPPLNLVDVRTQGAENEPGGDTAQSVATNLPPSDKDTPRLSFNDEKQEEGNDERSEAVKVANDHRQACLDILDSVTGKDNSMPFREPVDPVALGVVDYFTIIKQPMDLGTIRTKLQENAYQTVLEYAEDLRLTFRNAMVYNPPSSQVHEAAQSLLQDVENSFRDIVQNPAGIAVPESELDALLARYSLTKSSRNTRIYAENASHEAFDDDCSTGSSMSDQNDAESELTEDCNTTA